MIFRFRLTTSNNSEYLVTQITAQCISFSAVMTVIMKFGNQSRVLTPEGVLIQKVKVSDHVLCFRDLGKGLLIN